MADVVIIKCDSYQTEEVENAVKRGINMLGGVSKFAKKGEKIVFKPNLLAPDSPEKASVTHPELFRAIARVFKETGAFLSYGDSSGFGSQELVGRKTGFEKVATEEGVKLADFESGEDIFFEKAKQNKKFTIAKGILEADGVISIPKLKTHGLERMTGCVKNQFGCIPGLLKGEFHVRLPDAHDFAKMLVDLNNFVSPRLYIMDGIVGMEGGGPRGGDAVKMGVLLFSEDPIALDSVVCRMMNLAPEFVPTIKYGVESGSGVYKEEEINILGDGLEGFIKKDFNVEREPVRAFKKTSTIRLLTNLLVPKPIIKEKNCIKCGVCVNVCPVNPKALNFIDKEKKTVPKYDYNLCIRCYCCQEMCPESAISLKTPLVRKALRILTAPIRFLRN